MNPAWNTRPLEDLCLILNGLWQGKTPPFVNVGVVRNTNFRAEGLLDYSDIAYLDVEQRQFDSRCLQYGDIILEKSGGGPKQAVGRVALFDRNDGGFSFSNFTSIIRIADPAQLYFKFLHKYLYFLHASGVTEPMQTHSTGIRNLNISNYKRLPLPLPPLLEQHRIVELLDEAFEAIRVAKSNSARNLLEAEELLGAAADTIFEARGEQWVDKTLADLCDIGDGNHSSKYPTKSEMVTAGVPFIRATNLVNGRISRQEMRFITEKKHEALKKGHLRAGDILFSNRGEIGKLAIVDDDLAGSNLNSQLAWLRCRSGIDNRFLRFFLSSRKMRRHFETTQSGAALQQFTIKQLNATVIACPPLHEQEKIVSYLEQIRASVDELQRIYNKKAINLVELRQSILFAAFAGDLTSLKVAAP